MNDTRLVYACILSLHMHLSVMHHSPRLVVGADYKRGLTPAACRLVVSFPDCIFRARAGKMGLHLLQVCQNIGALFISNLMLDVIKNCIPQCMPTM